MSRLHVLSFLAGGFAAANAFAHHGIANFDLNKDIAISGTVSKLAFVNPHSWLYVSVVGADGRTAEWQCEMRAATVLRRSGWSEAMLTPGTAVSVTGSPDRQRAEHLLSRHDHVRRRHEHGSLWSTAENGRRGRRRPPGALAERRPEFERRLGRRAARHDGPPRHQRRARADQRRRSVGAGRRARGRARVPGRARHAGVARRQRDPGRVDAAEPRAADGGRAARPPRASTRRRTTIRGCAASRRTSCSTGASRRSRIASRRTRTRFGSSTARPASIAGSI